MRLCSVAAPLVVLAGVARASSTNKENELVTALIDVESGDSSTKSNVGLATVLVDLESGEEPTILAHSKEVLWNDASRFGADVHVSTRLRMAHAQPSRGFADAILALHPGLGIDSVPTGIPEDTRAFTLFWLRVRAAKQLISENLGLGGAVLTAATDYGVLPAEALMGAWGVGISDEAMLYSAKGLFYSGITSFFPALAQSDNPAFKLLLKQIIADGPAFNLLLGSTDSLFLAPVLQTLPSLDLSVGTVLLALQESRIDIAAMAVSVTTLPQCITAFRSANDQSASHDEYETIPLIALAGSAETLPPGTLELSLPSNKDVRQSGQIEDALSALPGDTLSFQDPGVVFDLLLRCADTPQEDGVGVYVKLGDEMSTARNILALMHYGGLSYGSLAIIANSAPVPAAAAGAVFRLEQVAQPNPIADIRTVRKIKELATTVIPPVWNARGAPAVFELLVRLKEPAAAATFAAEYAWVTGDSSLAHAPCRQGTRLSPSLNTDPQAFRQLAERLCATIYSGPHSDGTCACAEAVRIYARIFETRKNGCATCTAIAVAPGFSAKKAVVMVARIIVVGLVGFLIAVSVRYPLVGIPSIVFLLTCVFLRFVQIRRHTMNTA